MPIRLMVHDVDAAVAFYRDRLGFMPDRQYGPALVATLRDAGTTFRNTVITGPGGAQVLVEDPSGTPVELFQAAAAG